MRVVWLTLWTVALGTQGCPVVAAMLPPEFLNAVVAIENRHASSTSFVIGGTGVLVWYSETSRPKEGGRGQIFLVTARHVLKNKPSVYLRFNKGAGGPGQPFELSLRDARGKSKWIHPDDPEIDVAAIRVEPRFLEKHDVHIYRVPEWNIADSKKMSEVGISLGDNIYVLGFPSLVEGLGRKYVIVRSGIVSCLDEGVFDGISFLVEATVYPGNSGGPVFTRPTVESVGETRAVTQSYLVGIILKNLQYQDVAYSRQTDRARVVFMENSGLAVVLPMDYVNSMILKHLGRDK